MKRLLLRMSVLAMVVVLGWIAIAQAQRDQNESSEPGLLVPESEAANPLRRPDSTTLKPKDEAATVVQANAALDPPAALAENKPDTRLAANRFSNPFGLKTASHEATLVPPANGQDPPKTPPAASPTAGATPPEAHASPPVTPRYPQFPTAQAKGDKAAPAAPPREPAPPSTDRYANVTQAKKAPSPAAGQKDLPEAKNPLPTPSSPDKPQGDKAREPAPFRFGAFPAPLASQTPGASGTGAFAAMPKEASPVGASLSSTETLAGEGTGQPGSKQLEGAQVPRLTIEKTAPAEVQVGKPATFRVTVKNTGDVPAHGVEVRDRVPQGTRLVGTSPRASRGADGELVWGLGTLKPGDEVTVETELMPTDEGELGSVATVCFHADASVRTKATRPQLTIETTGPEQVLIGETLKLSITISNPGSGAASGVVLEEQVPPGLEHEAGEHLEYEVGELKPGESRNLELTLTARQAGSLTNLMTARGDAGLRVEDRKPIEVVAPKLDIALEGPKRRYLEREATYTLAVSNPGSAPAHDVELVAYLPEGFKFVSANNAGRYEPNTRAIYWNLEELPPSESGAVQLTAMPVESGQQTLRFRGTAKRVSPVEKEKDVEIEGIAAILFEVVDVNDPIEAGGETTYEIRILNQGTKAATNVRLAALLPPGMRPVAAEGPTRHAMEGNRVLFDGLSRLAPKADTTYRVRVQGLQPGDQRIRVQVLTDQLQTPVTKEESTRVYSDE